jgi:hypothetical protein
MRRDADWMTIADDRGLEFLSDEAPIHLLESQTTTGFVLVPSTLAAGLETAWGHTV